MAIPGLGSSMNLYRTFYPKYAHYSSDGMGRDGYILRHNGGLCHEREPNFQESTWYISSPGQIGGLASGLLKKEATAIKYCSDGSGRDAYILYNSGGNLVDSSCPTNP